MRDWNFPALPRRNAGRNALVFKPFAIPISIITAISQHVFGRWKLVEQCARTDVITGLACTQKHPQRPTQSISHCVQFGVHSAFGAPDQTPTPPFCNPRLEAVRCVFKWVASIMSVSVSLP